MKTATKYHILRIGTVLLLLLTMASSGAASSVSTKEMAAGSWKLAEVWEEQATEPMSIDEDGNEYFLKLTPTEHDDLLKLNIQISNMMGSQIEILNDGATSTIKIGYIMSTRMFPDSDEKAKLEGFLSRELPKMVSMEITQDDETESSLVLRSEGGAKLLCQKTQDPNHRELLEKQPVVSKRKTSQHIHLRKVLHVEK